MQEYRPKCQHTGCPKSHLTHRPIAKLLLGTPLHSREKKSISMHQNTDTSFPNQETLTSQSFNLTH